jgi:hypothetical protein
MKYIVLYKTALFIHRKEENLDKLAKWHWVKIQEAERPLYKRLINTKGSKVRLTYTAHPYRKGYIIDVVDLRKLKSQQPGNYYVRTIALPIEKFATVGDAYEYIGTHYKVASARLLGELAIRNHRILRDKVVLAGTIIPDADSKVFVAWCTNWTSPAGFIQEIPTLSDYAMHLSREVQGELYVLIEH